MAFFLIGFLLYYSFHYEIFPFSIMKLKALLPVFIFLSVTLEAHSQRAEVSRSEYLRTLSDSLEYDLESRRNKAIDWAKTHRLPLRKEMSDGRILELVYLDEFSMPVYYETRNVGAARTTTASFLHPGGALRLFVTGQGMTAGVWDGGRIQTDHRELFPRVKIKDSSIPSNHATHVGGTIIAKGDSSLAKGMAPDALISSYDWNSDLAEMAAEAADGLLLSNHSYGIVLGWGWSDGEWKWYANPDSTYDYRFGYYSVKSQFLDDIAFNAPYYQIVWAAGNDRNDAGDGSRPPDGPYNTIGPEGVAKNVLAIGAVNKLTGPYQNRGSVEMSRFSSWGPVNDGRIKPELVGAGVQLFSSINDNGYAYYSGTSMATPNVTGSLLLLQQLFMEQHGQFMKSATLRGLAIHTARPAGVSDGPDYQYGWGLLSAERAAGMILNRDEENFLIQEVSIAEGEEHTFEFEANGSGDIVATIAWTDPPATSVTPALSKSTLMLVNDLDLRIYDETGETVYLPWILNPIAPVSTATKGDNFRDNVERINIPEPPAGRYILKVTYKDSLANGSQEFSLILQTRDIPVRRSFYWIGGEGDWTDPSNWSLSSGGEPAEEIPLIEDHVVFDDNSFPASDEEQLLTVDADGACYSFNWLTTRKVIMEANNHSLSVYGSIYLIEDNQLQTSLLHLKVIGDQTRNVVAIPGVGFAESSLYFEGSGSWRIDGDLQVRKLQVKAGNVQATDLHMIVDSILVEFGYSDSLDIQNTSIEGLRILDFQSSDFVFRSENSKLKFLSQSDLPDLVELKATGKAFGAVFNPSSLRLVGNNSFRSVNSQGTLDIQGDNLFEELILLPESELILKENSLQVISEVFDVRSTADSLVIMNTDGDAVAMLEVLKYKRFCFDNLQIAGVSITGPGIFNAGENSFVDAKSAGWLTVDCEDILFADFEVQFACTNSMSYFFDRSEGVVDQRRWEFSLNEEIITSSQQDTIMIFTVEGSYLVSLTVSNDAQSETIAREIQVIENMLQPSEITFDGGSRFVSGTQAASYQWFLDGEPIPSARFRTFDNVNNLQGSLQVLISNGVCNILSVPILTSLSDLPDAGREFRLFPNPARSFIQLEMDPGMTLNFRTSVEIIDMNGRVLIQRTIEPWESQIILDVDSLKPGLYVLRVGNNSFSQSSRIIIQ